jgi:hypothetical protein
MEKIIRFNVIAGDKLTLKKVIDEINFQTKSDYKLVEYISNEVGIGTIEVSDSKLDPAFLFMMGARYMQLCKKIDLNFDY